MRKKGFTLAEVLITIGILGVISALTIPQLHNRTKNANLGPQYANAIATLENGIGTLLYEYNVKDLTQLPTAHDGIKTISGLLGKLYNDKYIRLRTFSGGPSGLPTGCSLSYSLPDKSAIGSCSTATLTVHKGNANQEMIFLSSKSVKQTNVIEGLDYFRMSLSADGMIYIPGSDYEQSSATCSRMTGGKGCAGKVANNGWKFDDSVYSD